MGLFGPPNIEKMKEKCDVKGLIKALTYQKSGQIRHTAAAALGLMGDARAVEPLIAALKNQAARYAAAKSLGGMGDMRAVQPLIDLLKDKDTDDDVRQAAAEALGMIGDACAVEPLIAAFKDNNKDVYCTAAEALGTIGEPAIKPLVIALKDQDMKVKRMAAKALGKAGWKPGQDENGALYYTMMREWEKCITVGSSAVSVLIAALEDEDPNVREGAAKALGGIGDVRAVEPLIASLQHKYWGVNLVAMEALGLIGDARAIPPLIAALPQATAAQALDQCGWQPGQNETGALYWIAKGEWENCVMLGVPAIQPLIAVLANRDVRDQATEALGKIGNPAVKSLIAALKVDDKDLHDTVTEALRRIGTPAVESLIAVLKDEDAELGLLAAEALGKIGPQLENAALRSHSVDSLIAALKNKNVKAAKALGLIGDERAADPLIASLQDQDWGLSCAAMEALGMIGDARAVEPLIKVLKDGKYEGRYYVGYCGAEALGKIGTPAVEPLIALLRAENAVVCMFAAKALGLIGDARAVEPLIAALKVDDKNLRRFAAEALGTIGDLRALPALIEMLKDLDKDLRQTAAFALGNIGDARAVEPLIAALKAEDKNERRAVVVALIRLYKVEQLDEVNKKLIFAHRSEITAPHMDISDNCSGGGYHASHIDITSVDFPL